MGNVQSERWRIRGLREERNAAGETKCKRGNREETERREGGEKSEQRGIRGREIGVGKEEAEEEKFVLTGHWSWAGGCQAP